MQAPPIRSHEIFVRSNALLVRFNGLTLAEAKTALTGLTLRAGASSSWAISAAGATTHASYLRWSSGPSWSGGDKVGLSLTGPTTTKPAKPTGLAAVAGDEEVALSWTNPNDSSITGYQYQQKAGAAAWDTTWTDIPGSGATTTSHTVTGLTNGTAYQFRIRAVNAAGNGPQSDPTTAVTPVADTTAPSAPSALALQSPSSSPGMDSTPTITVTVGETGGTVTLYSDMHLRHRSELADGGHRRDRPLHGGRGGHHGADRRRRSHLPREAHRRVAQRQRLDCSSATVAYTYDGTAPTVTGFTVASTPAGSGIYDIGEAIRVTATFSEKTVVTGSPTITLNVGGTDRTATYTATGSAGTTKNLRLHGGGGGPGRDGVSIDAGSVVLAGSATLKDEAGNAATLAHSGMATQAAHKADGCAPEAGRRFDGDGGGGRHGGGLSWSDPERCEHHRLPGQAGLGQPGLDISRAAARPPRPTRSPAS